MKVEDSDYRSVYRNHLENSDARLRLTILSSLLLFALGVNPVSAQAPVGTSFTYQAHLKESDLPANGDYDLELKLYDGPDPLTASQVGPTITPSSVTVTDGIFTVELDFGEAAFDGQARWLETSLGPAGSGSMTPLSPLQPLTPAPYALYALKAPSGSAESEQLGSLSPNSGFYNNRISDFSHSAAYTEVCFKNGAMWNDQHAAGGSTAGGDCLPGDRGWIIEAVSRPALIWAEAKAECLKYDMRLPEPFELSFSCNNVSQLGLTVGDTELASNSASLFYAGLPGVAVAIMNSANCSSASHVWVGTSPGTPQTALNYRCIR